jgi:hypothetical protein
MGEIILFDVYDLDSRFNPFRRRQIRELVNKMLEDNGYGKCKKSVIKMQIANGLEPSGIIGIEDIYVLLQGYNLPDEYFVEVYNYFKENYKSTSRSTRWITLMIIFAILVIMYILSKIGGGLC